ncbi:MAG: ATP-binding protein, partial [Gemmatimonadota bacterium]|nr:ATP-binding protein [Gemmatimonadota bacterium]
LLETIEDPARLATLEATGLLDSEVEEVFDRLTRLAVKLLGVPAAFLSLVDSNRDFYKSAAGFGEPLLSKRELSGRTFCHYAIQSSSPLVIDDTVADPVFREVPTVRSLGVGAYVGVPVVMENGHAIGSFCAIDVKPRHWTATEIEVLTEMAASAKREIELRGATRAERRARLGAEAARAAAEEANRAKSDFLTMMSHELRTPLNAIGGYADLIEIGVHGPVTPAQTEALGRIRRSATHLLGLINNVLNFAKVEAGQIEYTLSPVPLEALLRDTETMITPQMTAKSLRYKSLGRGDDIKVLADPEKMRQILLNLLTNAVKFTDVGGMITVTCGSEVEPPDDARAPRVFVRVTDSGIGIESGKLDSIFEPFVQIDSRLGARNDGVGLGLAISRSLARDMGGNLTAASTPGAGTTMTLVMPRA